MKSNLMKTFTILSCILLFVCSGGEAVAASITVTYPNGGEVLPVGSNQFVEWASDQVDGNVRIEYSVNNGFNWKTIVESTENDGIHPWIPTEASQECLVRVSANDVDDGPTDVSDAVFTVEAQVSGSITVRSPNGGERFEVGLMHGITWTSAGDFSTVGISSSADGGKTWQVVVGSAPNNGLFDWIIPDTVSDECLVRVAAADSNSDPAPSDVSDAVFSIVPPPTPTIKVTAPGNGEMLAVGASYEISWTAYHSREPVRIEYSTNAGGEWFEIVAATPNGGKFKWIVPDTPSPDCIVRVSEIDDDPVGLSDGLFSIIPPAPSDITVDFPNGGETFYAGSLEQIAWSSGGSVDGVSIEYSTDNGTSWHTIVPYTPNSGGFDWTIPKVVSDTCLIRVSSADGDTEPRPSDVSDAVFTIGLSSSQPEITVIAPNGGESFVPGTHASISWDSVSFRGDVKIEYSVDFGNNWILITDAARSTGSFEWLVPGTPSPDCLVRVSGDGGQLVDISDSMFSIVDLLPGEITVIAPNGGENWPVGSLQQIAWSPGGGINTVAIDYSTDHGISWQTIVQSKVNDGQFDWLVPASVSDKCLVRVTAADGDIDPKPSDVSDEVFSIVPEGSGELRVTSPNGGEEWEVGSIYMIGWVSSGNAGSVKIEYSADFGTTWSTIVASTGNTGWYDWQTPYTVSHECLVRISAIDGGSDSVPSDVSDEVFSLVPPATPTITVIAPNGGEELVIGSVFKILWFGSNSREEVQIEYSTNGGDEWFSIADPTENDGDFDWLVPDEPSPTCLVRISGVEGQPADISDAVFSIQEPFPSDLTVLAPNGGENLDSGSEFEITWVSSGLNNVLLEYSLDNGGAWNLIAEVPADDGNFTWIVPSAWSNRCLIRVTGAGMDESPWDISDEVFTIIDPANAFIEVFSPNGGESLGVGEEYYITWVGAGINQILIEYTTSFGDQWLPIDTVPAFGNRYVWTVPDEPSDICLIRLSTIDPVDGPSDLSDAVFSIDLEPLVENTGSPQRLRDN